MQLINLLKIINRLAFIFTLIGFLFALMDYQRAQDFLFIWVCLTTYGLTFLKTPGLKSIFGKLSLPGLFLPVVLMKTADEAAFTALICFFSAWIGLRQFTNYSHRDAVNSFRKGIIVLVILTFMALIFLDRKILEGYIFKYIIIYLVSTVILLRTIRYQELTGGEADINKINMLYAFLMIAISIFICLDNVRNFLARLMISLYFFLESFLFKLLYPVFLGIGYFSEWVVRYLQQRALEVQTEEQVELMLGKGDSLNFNVEDEVINNVLFHQIIRVVIIIAVLYLVYKLFSKLFTEEKSTVLFFQRRELIKSEKLTAKKQSKKFLIFERPKDANALIRYYFRRYIKLCLAKGIRIEKSDTTMDINQKAQVMFNRSIIEDLRNVYIKIRYGFENANQELVKKMAGYYKKLGNKKLDSREQKI